MYYTNISVDSTNVSVYYTNVLIDSIIVYNNPDLGIKGAFAVVKVNLAYACHFLL